MSQDTKELSLLEQLKQHYTGFVTQKEQAQANMNQLIGAIYACEVMIKKHEENQLKELVDGQVIQQDQEQVT